MTAETLQSPLIQPGVTQIGGKVVVPFLNGWFNYANGNQFVGFWKDADGIVHLRGFASGGAGGYGAGGYSQPNAIFQLPVGYRPGGVERFAAAAYPGGIKGASITIPSLVVSGDDANGVAIFGSTAPRNLAAPVLGSTWVDVLSFTFGGYVVAWQDAVAAGSLVSLSGISFYADH